jgi:EmrB/QacA subfamily drug resistance transporter
VTTVEKDGVGLRSERGAVLIALMLSVGLVAVDTTIIATVVPSIVADLGGFGQFPWLFSVYLLAQAVSVPIYSKLADQFGRKPMMLFGVGVFMLGSILCGAAWSMPALIAFRALQGLGAGAIQPVSLTIVGDIYTVAERGRVTGYFGSVWGIAAILGPTVGGLLAEFVHWRWVFFVNIPLCVAATMMLLSAYHERLTPKKHRLDYAGAALLASGVGLLILGLLEGDRAWAWRSWPSAVVLGLGVVLLLAFALVERRAAEPVLPAWLFRDRVLASASASALVLGSIVLGLTSYVPTFAQTVLGAGPLAAGLALAALSLGWPLASSQSAKLYLRYGYRFTALVGGALAITGTASLTFVREGSPILAVAACCFVIGAGIGLASTPILIAAQSTVGWAQRGQVTGASMFSRSIGSSLGVAVFGAIANATLGAGSPDPSTMDRAAHNVFLGVLVAAVLMVVAVATMPKTVEEHVEASPAPAPARG